MTNSSVCNGQSATRAHVESSALNIVSLIQHQIVLCPRGRQKMCAVAVKKTVYYTWSYTVFISSPNQSGSGKWIQWISGLIHIGATSKCDGFVLVLVSITSLSLVKSHWSLYHRCWENIVNYHKISYLVILRKVQNWSWIHIWNWINTEI